MVGKPRILSLFPNSFNNSSAHVRASFSVLFWICLSISLLLDKSEKFHSAQMGRVVSYM